jgi:hypothetical protein
MFKSIWGFTRRRPNKSNRFSPRADPPRPRPPCQPPAHSPFFCRPDFGGGRSAGSCMKASQATPRADRRPPALRATAGRVVGAGVTDERRRRGGGSVARDAIAEAAGASGAEVSGSKHGCQPPRPARACKRPAPVARGRPVSRKRQSYRVRGIMAVDRASHWNRDNGESTKTPPSIQHPTG